MEITTTRIVQAVAPTQKKLDELHEMAERLSAVRSDVWQRYGSLAGLTKLSYPRQVRDEWIRTGYASRFKLQARQWKMALDESFSAIKSLWSSAKTVARRSLHSTGVLTDEEKHYAFYLLKSDSILHSALVGRDFDIPTKFADSDINRKKVHKWLSSRLRRYRGSRPTQKKPQSFSLDACMYSLHEDSQGRLWIGMMSLLPRRRIRLLLTSPRRFSGNVRVVLQEQNIEVHYTEKEDCPEPKSEPDRIIGVDKGFTEVITDSEGRIYGDSFGWMLRTESDRLSGKNGRRNKIRAIAGKAEGQDKQLKADRITANNLGRKKYNQQKRTARKRIRTYMGTAIHEFVDNTLPDVVVGENLNFSYNGKKELPHKVKRYFSSWLKGEMQSLLTMRCQRSGATFVPVNAAYTSQVCSWCGCFGKRTGDIFHCPNCDRVVHADHNGARNVLRRYDDRDIRLFTPFWGVRHILEERFRTGETVHPGLKILV